MPPKVMPAANNQKRRRMHKPLACTRQNRWSAGLWRRISMAWARSACATIFATPEKPVLDPLASGNNLHSVLWDYLIPYSEDLPWRRSE